MNPSRRRTDAYAHAHLRASVPDDFPRWHYRVDDGPAQRLDCQPPKEALPMPHGMEDAPRTECADACMFGAFIGALAGCFLGGLVVIGLLVLWPGR